MTTAALFGSFDCSERHIKDLRVGSIANAAALFDVVYVVVKDDVNVVKHRLPLQERAEVVRDCLHDIKNVFIVIHDNKDTLNDFCYHANVSYVIEIDDPLACIDAFTLVPYTGEKASDQHEPCVDSYDHATVTRCCASNHSGVVDGSRCAW